MDHGIFNMHTDVNVCNCTWECMDTVESALKVNCGRKSLAAPGNSTCIGSVPIRCSTNRATAPPHFVSVQNFSFSVVWHLVRWPTCYSTMVCSVLQLVWGGDVDQLVEHRTGTLQMHVWFSGVARDFSPRVNFQYRLWYGVCTPPCAIACIYICAYVKDPVVHVRVWWIIETPKHPAYTIGWVVWPSQLAFPREGNPTFPWEKSHLDNTVVKGEKNHQKQVSTV